MTSLCPSSVAMIGKSFVLASRTTTRLPMPAASHLPSALSANVVAGACPGGNAANLSAGVSSPNFFNAATSHAAPACAHDLSRLICFSGSCFFGGMCSSPSAVSEEMILPLLITSRAASRVSSERSPFFFSALWQPMHCVFSKPMAWAVGTRFSSAASEVMRSRGRSRRSMGGADYGLGLVPLADLSTSSSSKNIPPCLCSASRLAYASDFAPSSA